MLQRRPKTHKGVYNKRVKKGGLPIKYEILFYKYLSTEDGRPIISPNGFVKSILGRDDLIISHRKGNNYLNVETPFVVYLETNADPSHYEIDEVANEAGIDFLGDGWEYTLS